MLSPSPRLSVALSEDEMEILLYCIEQQSYELNTEENSLLDRVCSEFASARASAI